MRTGASLRHRVASDLEELRWVHAHFHQWCLACATRAPNVGKRGEHVRAVRQRSTHEGTHLVLLTLTGSWHGHRTYELCTALAHGLVSDLAHLRSGPVQGNHRARWEKAEGLTLVEKSLRVVGG